MDRPLIEARSLDKTFGSSPILRAVNLRVEVGAGAIIVGRNGTGKSTLVSILAGLSAPAAGEALLFGQPSRALEPAWRRRVGLLTHQSFLYPNLSARENLEFYGRIYGLRATAAPIAQWLERVGLAAFADERVRKFSRGMEQRLALARVMLPAPQVLLMDEPFAALDPDGVALVTDALKEALTSGCALLITAHEPLNLDGMHFELHEIVRGRLLRHSEEGTRGRLRPVYAG